jgi:mono/diheme cytochrome c family protein
MLGAGDVLDERTPVIAPNLTPDRETGLGEWSDAEIVRAVREGVGRDGTRLRADHPTAYYRVMSDDDAAAVVAYLRSLKPIRNVLPRSRRQERFRESVQPVVAPAARTPVEPLARGAYLVQLGECLGCHTTSTSSGDPRRELAFGGGRRFVETRKGFGYELSPDPAFSDARPPAIGEGERIVTTANLTPDPSGIPYYTPGVFIQTIRTGRVAGVRKLSSAMPWIYFRRLTDDDLRAIFLYLQQVQPVRHHVSNTDEPTMCELCGRKHGLGEENRTPPRQP